MKRTWALSLLFLVAFASISVPAWAGTKGDVVQMDLATALERARSNDPAYLLAGTEVKGAKVSLSQVQGKNLIDPSPSMTIQAEAGLEIADKNLEMAEQELTLQVEQAYYNVLRTEKLIDVLQGALGTAARQLQVSQDRFRTGVATELDVVKSRVNVDESRADLLQAQDNLALAQRKFRQVVGLPEDAELTLDPNVVDVKVPEMTLDQAIEQGLTHRVELQQAAVGVKVAQKELQLADNDYTSVLTRRQNEVDVDKAALRLKQARQGIALDVQNAFNKMQDTHRRMAVAEGQLDQAQRNLDTVLALQRAQMSTDVEVMQSRVGLTQAELGRINAVFDFNIARATFFKALGLKLNQRSAQNGKDAPANGEGESGDKTASKY